MKVLDLLNEIKEIIETAGGFPLTGKVLVDAGEVLEILDEIQVSLPEEIQQAQWIKNERSRILDEAKREYENTLKEARLQAEQMVENDQITARAKDRADEITRVALENAKSIKLSALDYMDNLLYGMQEKFDSMNQEYLNAMFEKTQETMSQVGNMLNDNRHELKDMELRIQNE